MADAEKVKKIADKLKEEYILMSMGITAAVATFGSCSIKFTLDDDGNLKWEFDG